MSDVIIHSKGKFTVQNFFPTQNSQKMELNHLIRLSKVYNGFNTKPKIHISTYLIYFSVFFISYYILFFYSLNREFSFQLTDPIRRNVYQFRTECVEETNLWLHLNDTTINLFLCRIFSGLVHILSDVIIQLEENSQFRK